ncbi:MAG: DUF309 domain-containing protein [Candidatus Limnocylindria bacterium]
MTGAPGRVVQADGRSKAYRPLPRSTRIAAIVAGLEAYDRGDYFEAHEHLEPAWMGTDVVAERALLQGIIKIAAADVHGVRGNPAGVARNLEGALERLRLALAADPPDVGVDIDLDALVADAQRRLALAREGSVTPPLTLTWRPR